LNGSGNSALTSSRLQSWRITASTMANSHQ
jgi:hypothetical protein